MAEFLFHSTGKNGLLMSAPLPYQFMCITVVPTLVPTSEPTSEPTGKSSGLSPGAIAAIVISSIVLLIKGYGNVIVVCILCVFRISF